MKIAFDVDDTIYKISDDRKRQVPDFDMIQVLRWFVNNGDEVYVWSAGGVDYAQSIVEKFGLTGVKVIRKGFDITQSEPFVDLCFDDEEVDIAKVNIKVKRPDYNEK